MHLTYAIFVYMTLFRAHDSTCIQCICKCASSATFQSLLLQSIMRQVYNNNNKLLFALQFIFEISCARDNNPDSMTTLGQRWANNTEYVGPTLAFYVGPMLVCSSALRWPNMLVLRWPKVLGPRLTNMLGQRRTDEQPYVGPTLNANILLDSVPFHECRNTKCMFIVGTLYLNKILTKTEIKIVSN